MSASGKGLLKKLYQVRSHLTQTQFIAYGFYLDRLFAADAADFQQNRGDEQFFELSFYCNQCILCNRAGGL